MVDPLADSRRVDEMCSTYGIAGDEETLRFMYHLIHRSFRVWERFVLCYCSSSMAFRTGLRLGVFLLRPGGHRGMAAMFCVTIKSCHEWMAALLLMHMTRMSESELKFLLHLFSVSSDDYRNWARVGLVERDEMKNTFLTTVRPSQRWRGSPLPKNAEMWRKER